MLPRLHRPIPNSPFPILHSPARSQPRGGAWRCLADSPVSFYRPPGPRFSRDSAPRCLARLRRPDDSQRRHVGAARRPAPRPRRAQRRRQDDAPQSARRQAAPRRRPARHPRRHDARLPRTGHAGGARRPQRARRGPRSLPAHPRHGAPRDRDHARTRRHRRPRERGLRQAARRDGPRPQWPHLRRGPHPAPAHRRRSESGWASRPRTSTVRFAPSRADGGCASPLPGSSSSSPTCSFSTSRRTTSTSTRSAGSKPT